MKKIVLYHQRASSSWSNNNPPRQSQSKVSKVEFMNFPGSIKLSDQLQKALTPQGPKATDLTLGQIWTHLFASEQGRGFGIALMLTSLPSALPIPAPGYSTPFGVLLILLSLQIWIGRKSPWIPLWAKKVKLSAGFLSKMSSGLGRLFDLVEHFIKPRGVWIFKRGGPQIISGLVILMAILMIIPIPGTNTLPAMIVFISGLALAEEDGVLLVLAAVGALLATLFYGLLLFIIFYFGASGLSEAWEWVTGRMG